LNHQNDHPSNPRCDRGDRPVRKTNRFEGKREACPHRYPKTVLRPDCRKCHDRLKWNHRPPADRVGSMRHRTRGKMELTPTQKEILAKLKELNAKQAAALQKQLTSYAEFQEIEETENEIISLHRELVESVRLTLMQG